MNDRQLAFLDLLVKKMDSDAAAETDPTSVMLMRIAATTVAEVRAGLLSLE